MKYQQDLLITKKEFLNPTNFLLRLQSSKSLCPILPGQFVNILVENVPERMLRRPISIHDVDYSSNEISIIIQNIGKATEQLSLVQQGDKLNVVFPLGNGFPTQTANPLLIGGGVGIAPLYYLSKIYHKKGIKPTVLIGARTKQQLFLIEKYRQVANVFVTTEDGSSGVKGLVTTHPILSKPFSAILTCGPTLMMKAIANIARTKNIDCFVSLENRMACGIGACLCCVTNTITEGNVCICTRGPVFNANEIKW